MTFSLSKPVEYETGPDLSFLPEFNLIPTTDILGVTKSASRILPRYVKRQRQNDGVLFMGSHARSEMLCHASHSNMHPVITVW